MEIETGESNIQFGPAPKNTRGATFKRVVKGVITRFQLARIKFNPVFLGQFSPRFYMQKSQHLKKL